MSTCAPRSATHDGGCLAESVASSRAGSCRPVKTVTAYRTRTVSGMRPILPVGPARGDLGEKHLTLRCPMFLPRWKLRRAADGIRRFTIRCFRVALKYRCPWVPLALFIVGYVQIVRFVGAASDDARVRISLAAAQDQGDHVRLQQRCSRRALAVRRPGRARNAGKTVDAPVSNVFPAPGHSPQPPPWATIAPKP